MLRGQYGLGFITRRSCSALRERRLSRAFSVVDRPASHRFTDSIPFRLSFLIIIVLRSAKRSHDHGRAGADLRRIAMSVLGARSVDARSGAPLMSASSWSAGARGRDPVRLMWSICAEPPRRYRTAAFAVPSAILGEATLSFLGVGIIPPTPSWGQMINEGFPLFAANPWAVLLPAICISVVMLAFTFVGDGLRDALDPRMKT